MTTTPPASQPIVLPAWLQHFIVPVLMLIAVLGAGAPTLFGSIQAAHGNGLLIAGATSSYGGILVTAVLTFAFRWTWLKIALQVLSVLITIVVPFFAKGVFVPEVDGPILAVAVANGLLTSFGQYVRTQTVTKPVINARASNVVTSLPAADPNDLLEQALSRSGSPGVAETLAAPPAVQSYNGPVNPDGSPAPIGTGSTAS